jgi:muramoyltetrapeptide carboxypeptidase LdcA involved in peptidoglycan recycling
MTEMVPSGLMRGRWRRSQGLAREAPATERAGEQIGLAYSHRASAPLYATFMCGHGKQGNECNASP